MGLINNSIRFIKLLFGNNLFFPVEYTCPVITLGNKNASFTVNPEIISASDIAYSFGIGTDISFDLQLIEKYGVRVFAFDPTPKSIEWLKLQELPEFFKAFPVGLANYNGEADFYLPVNEKYVSASMTTRQSDNYVRVKVKTLGELAKEMGHTSIDLVKMDIEGAEFEVIDDILKSGIKIHQLLIEFHHRFHSEGSKITHNSIEKLKKSGYSLFYVSQNGEEFSFINLNYSK
jgi:FkbM family methyltransferase